MEIDEAIMTETPLQSEIPSIAAADSSRRSRSFVIKSFSKFEPSKVLPNLKLKKEKENSSIQVLSDTNHIDYLGSESNDNIDLHQSSHSSVSSLCSTEKSCEIFRSPSTKRKCYELRRSGSEECLLGFDEKSGEAEFLKVSSESDFSQGDERLSSNPVEKPQSPMFGKAAPSKSEEKINDAIPIQSSAVPQILIDLSLNKSETVKPRMHIVGDNEETNDNSETMHTSKTLENNFPNISKKTLSPRNEFFKKPFDYGWKRELVWRASSETSKDRADVYFITPGGKKLRTRNEIIPFLEGELTIEHFNFTREVLGAGPDKETVRTVKPSARVSITASTVATAVPNIGKRISKPKGPKGASPPPEGWTATRAFKVNNAALLTSTSSSRSSSSSVANHSTMPLNKSVGPLNTKNKSKRFSFGIKLNNEEINKTHKPCTIKCKRMQGQIPQLQCKKCLCLFHHQCVGLNSDNLETEISSHTFSNGLKYICKACFKPTDTSAKMAILNPSCEKKIHTEILTQKIDVIKGKKYVTVERPKIYTQPTNDIENDIKKINESIRNSGKHSIGHQDRKGTLQQTVYSCSFMENSSKIFASNFFGNVSFAYDALLCILKYLKIHERPRAASVCKLWNLASKDTSLWHTVRMKNSKVSSWAGFAAALHRGETKHLDLRKMLLSNTRSDEMWHDFSSHIGTVSSLESIDLCRCSAIVVENLFTSNKNLRVLNALAINDEAINLGKIGLLEKLQELRLRTCEPCELSSDLQPLRNLKNLQHLSLTFIRGLGARGIELLAELPGLYSLELGECGDFSSNFAQSVLPKLINLRRLRLENGQETNCCTLEILESVSKLEQLSQLELVNFDIKPGFDDKLTQCIHLRKLLIIPTYISQSATTNHIVLNAVQQVPNTLEVFTWGVTVELLRVTALYVDQCEESKKKEKHHFDECIPVLKPVPGAQNKDIGNETSLLKDAGCDSQQNDVPQIEILPLDKVNSILIEKLPKTKFKIVKIPYHATCKQQLVE